MKITDRLVAYAAESRKEAAATEAAASYLVTNPVSIDAPMVADVLILDADVLILGAHETAAGMYQESIRSEAVLMRALAARLVELANAAEKLAASPKAALALIGCAADASVAHASGEEITDEISAAGLESVPTCTPQQAAGLKRRGLLRMSGYSNKYSRSAVRPNDVGWLLVRAMLPGPH